MKDGKVSRLYQCLLLHGKHERGNQEDNKRILTLICPVTLLTHVILKREPF